MRSRKPNSEGAAFRTPEEALKYLGVEPDADDLPPPDSKSPESIWDDYFNEFSRFLLFFGRKKRAELLAELKSSAEKNGDKRVLSKLEGYCRVFRQDLSAEDIDNTRRNKFRSFEVIDRIVDEVNADYKAGKLDLRDFEEKIRILMVYK